MIVRNRDPLVFAEEEMKEPAQRWRISQEQELPLALACPGVLGGLVSARVFVDSESCDVL